MIPLKLTLEGLYSYQKRQEIDFTRLTESELFGIFGATGSGKSSILEAISFALYNQTERLSSRESGGTAYHMMNLKSDRIYLDFEFAAGVGEEQRYRFVVENKRNRKDFYKTQNWQRRTFIWTDENWLPLEETSAEQLIGLSYDHFKRTIIIPQGKFEEFIQLKSTDRSRMLQDIFGLEKYELSGKVKKLIQENQVALATLEGRLGQYQSVTPEAIEENKQERAALELERDKVVAELKLKTQQREQQEQLREQFAKIVQKEEELSRLEQQLPHYQSRQGKLDRYVRAKDEFGVDLSEKDRQVRQLKELDQRLQEKRSTQERVKQELTKKQALFGEVEKNYQQRDELKRKEEELSRLLQLKDLSSSLEALESRVAKGKARVESAESKVQQYDQKVAELETAVELLEKQRPDLDQLVEIEKWYAESRRLQENLAREEKMRGKLTERVERGKVEKQQLARQVGIDLSDYPLSTSKLIARLKEQRDSEEIRLAEIRTERDQLQLRQSLHQMAGDLKPGEACPLCGSTDHPTMQHRSEDVRLKQVEAELKRTEEALEQIRQVLPRLDNLLEQAKELSREIQEVKESEQELRQSLDLHQSQFVWPGYQQENDAAVRNRLDEGRQLEQQRQQHLKQIKDLRSSAQEEKNHIHLWRPELDKISKELNTRQGEFDSGRKLLTLVKWESYLAVSSERIHSDINQLKIDYQGRIDLFERLQQEIEERKSRIDTLGGEISALDHSHEETASSLAQLNQKLDKRVQASDFESLEVVRTTLEFALNIDAEKEALREFDRQLTEARTTLRDLREQVGDQQFELAAFEALVEEIKALEQQQADLTQQIGGKEEYGKRLMQELEEKKALAKELKRLQLRADNLKILEGLFRGNGFVNYISTAYLENLCAAANERFLKLNQNSLSLEVDEDNNFHVRDLLNGGKRRSIKTLSGGQTFQAALCLALALSDQVQQQVQARQNFFFLDEGFGSQDKNSLQTIFRTLKSLRQENRIVGVISHVEELQQEIDTYLHVHNDAEVGSVIQRSWE